MHYKDFGFQIFDFRFLIFEVAFGNGGFGSAQPPYNCITIIRICTQNQSFRWLSGVIPVVERSHSGG